MRAAVVLGAALGAACQADPDEGRDAGAGGSGGVGGSGGMATGGDRAAGGSHPTGGNMPPAPPSYPSAPAPAACPENPDAGEPEEFDLGPCCPAIRCYEPGTRPGGGGAGGAPSSSADDCVVPGEILPGRGNRAGEVAELLGYDHLGSGQCLCGVQGPFDRSSARAHTDDMGRCCYSISIQWCTGRPLLVEDVARMAPLVLRSDWA